MRIGRNHSRSAGVLFILALVALMVGQLTGIGAFAGEDDSPSPTVQSDSDPNVQVVLEDMVGIISTSTLLIAYSEGELAPISNADDRVTIFLPAKYAWEEFCRHQTTRAEEKGWTLTEIRPLDGWEPCPEQPAGGEGVSSCDEITAENAYMHLGGAGLGTWSDIGNNKLLYKGDVAVLKYPGVGSYDIPGDNVTVAVKEAEATYNCDGKTDVPDNGEHLSSGGNVAAPEAVTYSSVPTGPSTFCGPFNSLEEVVKQIGGPLEAWKPGEQNEGFRKMTFDAGKDTYRLTLPMGFGSFDAHGYDPYYAGTVIANKATFNCTNEYRHFNAPGGGSDPAPGTGGGGSEPATFCGQYHTLGEAQAALGGANWIDNGIHEGHRQLLLQSGGPVRITHPGTGYFDAWNPKKEAPDKFFWDITTDSATYNCTDDPAQSPPDDGVLVPIETPTPVTPEPTPDPGGGGQTFSCANFASLADAQNALGGGAWSDNGDGSLLYQGAVAELIHPGIGKFEAWNHNSGKVEFYYWNIVTDEATYHCTGDPGQPAPDDGVIVATETPEPIDPEPVATETPEPTPTGGGEQGFSCANFATLAEAQDAIGVPLTDLGNGQLKYIGSVTTLNHPGIGAFEAWNHKTGQVEFFYWDITTNEATYHCTSDPGQPAPDDGVIVATETPEPVTTEMPEPTVIEPSPEATIISHDGEENVADVHGTDVESVVDEALTEQVIISDPDDVVEDPEVIPAVPTVEDVQVNTNSSGNGESEVSGPSGNEALEVNAGTVIDEIPTPEIPDLGFEDDDQSDDSGDDDVDEDEDD